MLKIIYCNKNITFQSGYSSFFLPITDFHGLPLPCAQPTCARARNRCFGDKTTEVSRTHHGSTERETSCIRRNCRMIHAKSRVVVISIRLASLPAHHLPTCTRFYHFTDWIGSLILFPKPCCKEKKGKESIEYQNDEHSGSGFRCRHSGRYTNRRCLCHNLVGNSVQDSPLLRAGKDWPAGTSRVQDLPRRPRRGKGFGGQGRILSGDYSGDQRKVGRSHFDDADGRNV